MALKIYGSFMAELVKTGDSDLDRILLYGDGMPIAYFMTPITYLAKDNNELEVRFNINNQNIAIDTGEYALKLIFDDNGRFSHICLLKKCKNIYDVTFVVAVKSIIANTDDKIKVKFIISKSDVDQTIIPELTLH